MASTQRTLRGTMLVSVVALGLLATPSQAETGQEAIRTATAACLDTAAKQGWRSDLAKVISSRSIDADKVEVVFDLTRDGTNSARLTCPYSLSKGVATTFGTAASRDAAGNANANAMANGNAAAANANANGNGAAANGAAADGAAAGSAAAGVVPLAVGAEAGTPVNGNRAWWLLLPLGLGILSWAALRGAGDAGAGLGAAAAGAVTTGTTTSRNILVEADAADGALEVREHADIATRILRRVPNGERLALTGHRFHDWLEVATGGWVRDIDVRYDRSVVRFS